jgi:hypothetical protein
MKPIDKAIFGMVSESLGRNESERIGGLESPKLQGPSPHRNLRNFGTRSETLAGRLHAPSKGRRLRSRKMFVKLPPILRL